MDNRLKRVVTIQDLSSFGRCAITVVLPVMSAMGVQVVALPTAVLSTHFGGMGTPAFHDLTDFLGESLDHYKKLELEFDCIYTGYLGSPQQVKHCIDYFESFPAALKVVDPVMGDHGKAYTSCGEGLQGKMRELVTKADIITPNLTEVCLLLKEEYPKEKITETQVENWLKQLADLGPKKVVITGISLEKGQLTNFGYDSKKGEIVKVTSQKVDANYPGTGDCFTGIMTAGLTKGKGFEEAIQTASDYVGKTILVTKEAGTNPNHGILLEKTLPTLYNC